MQSESSWVGAGSMVNAQCFQMYHSLLGLLDLRDCSYGCFTLVSVPQLSNLPTDMSGLDPAGDKTIIS